MGFAFARNKFFFILLGFLFKFKSHKLEIIFFSFPISKIKFLKNRKKWKLSFNLLLFGSKFIWKRRREESWKVFSFLFLIDFKKNLILFLLRKKFFSINIFWKNFSKKKKNYFFLVWNFSKQNNSSSS